MTWESSRIILQASYVMVPPAFLPEIELLALEDVLFLYGLIYYIFSSFSQSCGTTSFSIIHKIWGVIAASVSELLLSLS